MKWMSDERRRAMFANMGKGFSTSKGKAVNPWLLDRRSKKRKRIDMKRRARKRFPPSQVDLWAKRKTTSDLVGFDTKVRVRDSRSQRAINQDRREKNSKVLRLTPKNYKLWKKNPGKYDLAGWDTKMPVKSLEKQVKVHHRRIHALKKRIRKDTGGRWKVEVKGSGFKKKQVRTGSSDLDKQKIERLAHYVKGKVQDPQTVDINALIDPSLNYAENKEILRKILEPKAKDFIGTGICEAPMSARIQSPAKEVSPVSLAGKLVPPTKKEREAYRVIVYSLIQRGYYPFEIKEKMIRKYPQLNGSRGFLDTVIAEEKARDERVGGFMVWGKGLQKREMRNSLEKSRERNEEIGLIKDLIRLPGALIRKKLSKKKQ